MKKKIFLRKSYDIFNTNKKFFVSNRKRKKFLPYRRVEIEDKGTVYIRNDHINYRLRSQEKIRNKAFQNIILGDNALSKNFTDKKKYIFWFPLKELSNSFNETSLFFLKKKRWNVYQKQASVKWSNYFSKQESWKNLEFKFFTDFYIEERKKRWTDAYYWRFFNLNMSKDGFRIYNLLLTKRIKKTSEFWFLSKSLKLSEIYKKQRLSIHHSVFGNNRFYLERKIKRDYLNKYKTSKYANFIPNPHFKLWRRVFQPFAKKYLGNKTLGDLKYLSKKQTKDTFFKNTAGFFNRIASNLEYTISNIILQLKMCLTLADSVKLVKSGRILVNNKIYINPNKKVPIYSTIKYKGNWFMTYLLSCIQEEDRSFERFPSRTIKKSNSDYIRRFFIPSYFEISFKLQEAILLRQSSFFEQPKPYVLAKANLPEHLKTHFKKRGIATYDKK